MTALPDAILTLLARDSRIARFLFAPNLKKGRTVRYNAFMPPEDDLRLSVCDRDGLSTEEVQEWGIQHASRDGGPPKGFAGLQVADVMDKGLRVERDDMPPRHAAVVPWSGVKEERIEKAKELLDSVSEVQLVARLATTTFEAGGPE